MIVGCTGKKKILIPVVSVLPHHIDDSEIYPLILDPLTLALAGCYTQLTENGRLEERIFK
jgi:hypothetical protein